MSALAPWLASAGARADARFFGRYRGIAENTAQQFGPRIAAHLLGGYDARVGITTAGNGSPVKLAGTWLQESARTLIAANITHAYDEPAIRDYANSYSRSAARIPSLARRAAFAQSLQIPCPAGKHMTESGALQRLASPHWWRRQLRRQWTRSAENCMRDMGTIRRGRAAFASDEAVSHRIARSARTKNWLASRVMDNGQGEQLEMLALAEKSLANPAIRRGEFMTRLRGFDEIARDLKHDCDFWTLTAPSAYHAQLKNGGENALWEKFTVREAQAWLSAQWAKVRAWAKRKNISFYGFRAAEPHHDATPHWHLLIFGRPSDLAALRVVIHSRWLSTHANERGALEHRAQVKRIDKAKGSAVGYLAKYIAKNVDGAGSIGAAVDDETGGAVSEAVGRVAAWASVHGIRQFQQIGGPPVGLWRECRRVRDPVADADIERARAAADRGDWRGFVYAMTFENITSGPRSNVTIERADEGRKNCYGELRPPIPIGLRCCSALVLTRPHRWTMKPKPVKPAQKSAAFSPVYSDLGPVAISVRACNCGECATGIFAPYREKRGADG